MAIKRKKPRKRPFGEPRSFNGKLYTYRLSSLSTQDWIELGQRFIAKCDWLMHQYVGSGKKYGHGGALSFGWDWPTFSVIYPRVYAIKRLFVAEAARRKGERVDELMALSNL